MFCKIFFVIGYVVAKNAMKFGDFLGIFGCQMLHILTTQKIPKSFFHKICKN
jgi:hypothetical protein